MSKKLLPGGPGVGNLSASNGNGGFDVASSLKREGKQLIPGGKYQQAQQQMLIRSTDTSLQSRTKYIPQQQQQQLQSSGQQPMMKMTMFNNGAQQARFALKKSKKRSKGYSDSKYSLAAQAEITQSAGGPHGEQLRVPVVDAGGQPIEHLTANAAAAVKSHFLSASSWRSTLLNQSQPLESGPLSCEYSQFNRAAAATAPALYFKFRRAVQLDYSFSLQL